MKKDGDIERRESKRERKTEKKRERERKRVIKIKRVREKRDRSTCNFRL